ncbi:Hypothetical_protein [Hexamita inflata]|uniref:Hypothetical_protein n=1 Tax=Hexamita inflata TaxID=28002 RepID=A0AA86NZ14_9EUKA|nr:Hypothetical protein HINF_LOCUS15623 [Hexamita inflata]
MNQNIGSATESCFNGANIKVNKQAMEIVLGQASNQCSLNGQKVNLVLNMSQTNLGTLVTTYQQINSSGDFAYSYKIPITTEQFSNLENYVVSTYIIYFSYFSNIPRNDQKSYRSITNFRGKKLFIRIVFHVWSEILFSSMTSQHIYILNTQLTIKSIKMATMATMAKKWRKNGDKWRIYNVKINQQVLQSQQQ